MGRKVFLNALISSIPSQKINPKEDLSSIIWGIKFKQPLFNAAGMFKTGYGYELAVAQGAGAFLAGTTTHKPRSGNKKNGVLHPFAAFPKSHSAINWMGLPNPGHEEVAKELASIIHKEGCPIGASIAPDPDALINESVKGLLNGLNIYQKAGVDFIEINESCPNVPHGDDCDNSTGLSKSMIDRLNAISIDYLKRRSKSIPVIVKLSNDLHPDLLIKVLDLLIDLGYDGINLGNTSTDYLSAKEQIVPFERKLLDYFSGQFGGGISGSPLRNCSLKLVSVASDYLKTHVPGNEFHIIRTGGISESIDLIESQRAGASLNQWFTGYFENFALHGHRLYKKIWETSP
jgi:dihydroorotate dehydrogenase